MHNNEQQQAARERRWEWERLARLVADGGHEPPRGIEVKVMQPKDVVGYAIADLRGMGREHRMTCGPVVGDSTEYTLRRTRWAEAFCATLFFLDESMNNLGACACAEKPKTTKKRSRK